MGRPPKRNDDDLDIYNEEALNRDNVEGVEQGVEHGPDAPYDAETDDILPELGQESAHERLNGLGIDGADDRD